MHKPHLTIDKRIDHLNQASFRNINKNTSVLILKQLHQVIEEIRGTTLALVRKHDIVFH